jgi:hypothetical protein
MRTQWHPLFAKLLRPLVESHYEVETNVAVGDAPRAADLVLLRRTSAASPPFQGLWRWLSEWNVLEFKGPSVSARVADLDLLVELGLGIHRRLNEQRRKERQPEVGRDGVSFWYLAPHLGRRFLAEARGLLGDLEGLEAGVWRGRILGRQVFLVSNRAVPVERDSVPVHLLTPEPIEETGQLVQVLRANQDLLALYGPWLATSHPALWEEVTRMGRKKEKGLSFDLGPLIEKVGIAEVIKQFGLERVTREVVAEKGLPWFVGQLTPEQREQLKRLL